MDKLYTSDIPSEFHYARFSSNYIDLYDTDVLLPNTNYTYYRVYMYDNYFAYEQLNTSTGSYYSSTYLNNIDTTNNIAYRRDFPSIVCVTFIIAIFGIWLFNIVSSIINKGGVLGGLL